MDIMYILAGVHDQSPDYKRSRESSKELFDDVKVLSWDRSKIGLPKFEKHKNLVIHRFKLTAKPRSVNILIVSMIYQLWVFYHLIKYRPKIVQSLDFFSALPAGIYAFIFRSKFIYDMLDPFSISFNFPTIIRKISYSIDWFIMSLAHAFIVRSEDRLFYLGRWRKKKNYVIIKNTCFDLFEELPDPPEILRNSSDNIVRLAFIGYLVYSRGAKWLLEFVESQNGDVELLVVGTSRDDRLAKEIENANHVLSFGRRPYLETLSIMKSVDAICLLYDPSIPINRLSAPNKQFEAMMVGTPVLVSEGMNIASMTKENDLGYVLEYKNIKQLQEVVEKLRDKSKKDEFRKRVRKIFKEKFELSRYLDKYNKFYKEIIEKV